MSQVKSGRIVGTGAAINQEIGFVPSRVEMFISESGIKGFWDDSMPDGTFLVEDCTELRTGEILIGSSLPCIGSTPAQLANYRQVGYFDGAGATAIELAATAAGTAFTATTHDITALYWASYKLSIQTGGTITITMSASEYATEALAIAALAATPANEISLGYITIYGGTSGFNATTDSLAASHLTVNYYRAYGVNSAGITPYSTDYEGFTIGTAAQLNIAGSDIYYKAYRD